MPAKTTAYDPYVNYWENNHHLRFLMQRFFMHPQSGNEEFDTIDEILKTAGKLGQEFAQKWHDNEETGSKLEYVVDSSNTSFTRVILPTGTNEAIRKLRELGMIGITLPEKYGGLDLPAIVDGALALIMFEADPAMYLIPGITGRVAETLFHFASEELKQKYIPNLCSSNPDDAYTGAMLLTEPQAGSDLASITTSAKKVEDNYIINGRKIFITNPDADVLVMLARGENAPRYGTKGLSLFLVPKFLDDGTRNGVRIARLENKMGMSSSPTGEVLLENSVGYLVGEEANGFQHMLYLMNRSRPGIGTQGLAIAERGFLMSVAYCAERMQFRQPLDRFPLMQENLVHMRIEIEAATSLIFRTYSYMSRYPTLNSELRKGGTSPEDQARNEQYYKLARILIPLSKYRGSELAVSIADRTVSNFGGYGYIAETGVERLIRAAKITTIYEGTNDIQALDVLRGIAKEGTLASMSEDVNANLSLIREDSLKPYAEKVKAAMRSVDDITRRFTESESPVIAAQVEARKVVEFLITVYEASLMLEEAQHLIDTRQDWRKAVMTMKYIDDKMSPFGENITGKMTAVRYFSNIVRHEKLLSFNLVL